MMNHRDDTANRVLACDVAICGGGLAGLTLARQLKLAMPRLSIVLLDRLARPLPEAAFKVGESTVEVGAYYLGQTLKLHDYFDEHHLYKLGLRYFFGDSQGPFQDRPEFGLSEFPPVSSYQIDRGLLENDLRRFNAEAGVQMLEGCAVRAIALANGNGRHEISFKQRETGAEGKVHARWVIDAMGRRRYLQKKLDLAKAHGRPCSAAWFRLEGRIDVSDLAPRDADGWHRRVPENNRYYSTTHLMGKGYWVWLIPLSSGSTSVGIVALEDVHPFAGFNTYPAALQWLRTHEPVLAAYIEGREPLDFKVMRRYSYSSRQVFSEERWACVGEAGVFSDPFYSPGTDMIGFANTAATEMIRLDLEGELAPETVTEFNRFILALNELLTHNIQQGYPLFGSAVVSAAKLIWDVTVAWSIYGPQMFNSIYVDAEKNAQVRKVTGKFFLLTQQMHRLFVDWEAKSPGRLTFDFIDYLTIPFLKRLRLRNLRSGKSLQELIDDHVENMERLEELAQVLFLLAVEDVMPERLDQFPAPVWLNAWHVGLDPARWPDRLFRPTSAPRDLEGMRAEIRSLFHSKERQDAGSVTGVPAHAR